MLQSPLQTRKSPRRLRSNVLTLPPPVGGWVTMNDPRSDNLNTARILRNLVPRRTFAESRGGCSPVCITEPGIIETMMSYQSGELSTLLAVVNGKIFDCPETPLNASARIIRPGQPMIRPAPGPPIRVVANYNLVDANGVPNTGELYFLNSEISIRPHNIDADGQDVGSMLESMPTDGTATVTIDGLTWDITASTDSGQHKRITVDPAQGRPDGDLYEVVFEWPADNTIPNATLLQDGFSNSRFQSVLMANASDQVRLIMVNGEDGIFTYDPDNGVETLATDPDVPDMIDVTTHKGRLWFAQTGTSTLWYGDPFVNNPGTLTPFYVGPLLKKGGDIIAIDSISNDGGSGPDDFFIAVSTEGEVVVFQGLDPDTDFQLIGNFSVSKPVGPRCLAKIGTDLMYWGSSGPEGLRKLLSGVSGRADVTGIAIQDQFENAYQSNYGQHGFEILHYSRPSWIMFNVPKIYPTNTVQYVFNLETSAWFEITGWNAISWVEHQSYAYYGSSDGCVYISDFGADDAGEPIDLDFMANWSEYQTPNLKKFNMAKVTVRSQHKPSPLLDIMTDYDERTPRGTTAFPQKATVSAWNSTPWDTSPWTAAPVFNVDTFGLTDHGYVGAFRYREQVIDSFLQFYGYQLIFEVGDVL